MFIITGFLFLHVITIWTSFKQISEKTILTGQKQSRIHTTIMKCFSLSFFSPYFVIVLCL